MISIVPNDAGLAVPPAVLGDFFKCAQDLNSAHVEEAPKEAQGSAGGLGE